MGRYMIHYTQLAGSPAKFRLPLPPRLRALAISSLFTSLFTLPCFADGSLTSGNLRSGAAWVDRCTGILKQHREAYSRRWPRFHSARIETVLRSKWSLGRGIYAVRLWLKTQSEKYQLAVVFFESDTQPLLTREWTVRNEQAPSGGYEASADRSLPHFYATLGASGPNRSRLAQFIESFRGASDACLSVPPSASE